MYNLCILRPMAIYGGENLSKVTVIAAFLFLMWLTFVQHNPVLTWLLYGKDPAHVPSNQAINSNKQTKQQNTVLAYYQQWFYWIHKMLHWCYIPYTVPISGNDATTVLALWHYHSLYRSLMGCLIVKCFCFFVFFFTKRCQWCVFLNSKSKYTGVPLHICTDVKGNGENDKRGIMDAKEWAVQADRKKMA